MATAEEKVAVIEKRQRELIEEAERAEREGDYFSVWIARAGAQIMESDKMFIVGDELLEAYRSVIRDGTIELNGMKWPIDAIIIPTTMGSDEYSGEDTAG
ncbi:MAG: hypothetical protein HYT62_04810 [Candidatus Yanofskybacteria bacterium]|nr:hypothetical protein [Candidatus Yanofskybacteria bacterium]